jgi:hypothetical protein
MRVTTKIGLPRRGVRDNLASGAANPYPLPFGYETKRHTNKQTRYTSHRNYILCRHFPYLTSRKGTRTTEAANALLTQSPQNPPHHPARSNRHHLQQPHKTPTPQPQSYWATCHNINERTRHWTQPPKIFKQYSWWWAGFCLPTSHLIPSKKLLLIKFFRWNAVSLHPLGGANTKQHPFLIHAGSVYAICDLFLFFAITN